MTEPPNSLTTDEPTKHPRKFINLVQTPEERRQKYWLAKSCGASFSLARRCRDWRLSKIERLFHLKETYDPSYQEYSRDLTGLVPTT